MRCPGRSTAAVLVALLGAGGLACEHHAATRGPRGGARVARPPQRAGADATQREATAAARPRDTPPASVPRDLVGVDGGAAWVWAEPAANGGSVLLYQRVDDDGRARGSRAVLGQSDVPVLAVQAARVGDRVAVGWCGATSAARERYGVVWARDDGAVVGALASGLEPGVEIEAIAHLPVRGCGIEVIGDTDPAATAVFVATRNGRWACRDARTEQDVPCGQYGLFRVTADGTVDSLWSRDVSARRAAEPMTPVRTSRFAFVAIERAEVPHGTALMYRPARPLGWTRARWNTCRPPTCGEGTSHLTGLITGLAWDGGGTLVGLGRHLEQPGLWAWAMTDRGGFEGVPAFRSPRGGYGYARVEGRELRCANGLPGVRWVLDSGARFDFDPFAAGSSYRWATLLRSPEAPDAPAAAAWTGRSLLVAHGDGRTEVYRCHGEALEAGFDAHASSSR